MSVAFIAMIGLITGGDPLVMPDVAGKSQRPLDVLPGKANVLVFVLSDCPIANKYVPELNRLEEEFSRQGIRFFIVLADPDITNEEAARHAEDFGYRAPVLVDRGHRLVEQWKVEKAPTAVVLSPEHKILYQGRVDDRWVRLGKALPEPTRKDLRLALAARLTDAAIENETTEVIGCHIPRLKGKK